MKTRNIVYHNIQHNTLRYTDHLRSNCAADLGSIYGTVWGSVLQRVNLHSIGSLTWAVKGGCLEEYEIYIYRVSEGFIFCATK